MQKAGLANLMARKLHDLIKMQIVLYSISAWRLGSLATDLRCKRH